VIDARREHAALRHLLNRGRAFAVHLHRLKAMAVATPPLEIAQTGINADAAR
jgi:hypothetical protein